MLPPVFKVDELDGNAKHNLFGIWIRRDLKHFDAILAQEKFEWWFLRKWNALTLAPVVLVALLVGGDEGLMVGVIGALAAYFAVYSFGPLKRHMELVGHMIETLWAVEHDGADLETYLHSEATVLARYDQFKGWTVDRIKAAMREVEPIARKHI